MGRLARRLATGIFSVAVFGSASFASVLEHLQLPIARASIGKELDRVLASTFAGRVHVDGVESIGPHGIRAKELTADDPDGVRVLRATGVELDVSLVDLARASLLGKPIVVDGLRVEDANVSLAETKKGLRIERAFAARKPSTGPSTLELTVHDVAIRHAWIHGVVSGQIVDLDATGASGEVRADGGRIAVDVAGADVRARALPRHLDFEGRVSGHVVSDTSLGILAQLSGRAGGVAVRASGRLDGDRFSATLDAPSVPAARVRALLPDAPIHEDVSAHVSAAGAARDFAFRATGSLGPARLAGEGTVRAGDVHASVRATHLDVRAFAPSLRPSDARADATLDLAGGIARVRGDYDPPGGHATFDADLGPHAIDGRANANVADARSALGAFFDTSKIAGHGTLRATAHLDRDTNALALDGSARLEDVAVGPLQAGALRATVSASGPMSNPIVGVDLSAERPVLPEMHVAAIEAHARGALSNARVTVRVAAQGTLELAARASIGHGVVALDDVDVRENGEHVLGGSLRVEPASVRVRAIGRRIDLAALRRTLGFEPALAGTVALDLDATLAGKSLAGRLALDARGVDFGRARKLDLLAHASSFERATSLVLRARMPALGWVSVESVDLRLDGPSLERASWERAVGTLGVDGTLSLGELAALFGRPRSLEGWSTVSLVARRASKAERPDLAIRLKSAQIAIGRRAWPLAVDARAHLDPSGALDAHVDAAHRTEHARLDATSTLAWSDVLAGRTPDLASLPFTADLDVPAFDLGPLCADLHAHCRGSFAAAAHATGPLDRVHGSVAGTLVGFRSNASPIAEIADASVVGTLDRGGGKVRLVVSHFGSKDRELEGTADVHVPDDPRAWYATIDLRAKDLPLRLPPLVGTERAYATVTGTASIANFHRDARARVDLRADDLGWGDVVTDRATLAGELDGRALALTATTRAQTSSAEIHLGASATWGAAMTPTLASNDPIRFAVRANDFRLQLLMPLVPLSVGSIDGRLDADASGTVQRAPMRVTGRGWAKLAQTTVESSTLGEIQDLAATVDFRQDGTIALKDAHFRGTRGLVTVTGRALAPGGALREIDLGATVDRADPFPLVVSGQRVGDVWGRVAATARPEGKGLAVKLDVPTLHVTLPDVTHGTPQSLDAAEDIAIGIREKNGRLAPVALAPPSRPQGTSMPIHVELALGNDVRITRDDSLSLAVSGSPRVEIGRTTRAFGAIQLSRGTIEIENRRFALEPSVVTFDGDPANPMLAVTAGWTASDRTRVTARYVGRADRGKLELTSDPPHTRDEIVALLVFGSAGGPTPGSGGTTGAVAAATAVGGASFATQPFNKALEQLTHVDIKTRVDTSGSTAKSEVQVQIAKHIWAQIAYVLGLPPPGTEPDRTWLTLAWYATAHWSFDFTVGDHGSTIIDALWERRY